MTTWVKGWLRHSTKKRLALLTVILIVVSLCGTQATSSLRAQQGPYANGRFGFGVTKSTSVAMEQGWPSYLNAGWYWDWVAKGETQLPPLKYAQTIRLSPVKSDNVQIGYTASPTGTTLLAKIAAQPGATWFIGNEPDCTLMDNMISTWYARAYHDLYHIIKTADPTAQIAAGNIVQPTPQRLEYLNRALAAYQAVYGEPLPADVWVIHSYILCEKCYPFNIPLEPFAWGACWVPDWPSRSTSEPLATFYSVYDHWDMDIFTQRIIDFRQWMYDNGYRDHPLMIAEYGVLFYQGLVSGMGQADDIAFMNAGFDWMREARDPVLGYKPDDNRLVQRWAWFSLDHGNYPGGTLFDPYNLVPTYLGTAYAAYTSQITPSVDLKTLDVILTAPTAAAGTPVTATVNLTVSNAGDVDAEGTIVAKIIANTPDNPTHSAPVGGTVLRPLECCGDHEPITITWPNYITSTNYEYYITVLDIDLRLSDVWTPMQFDVITPTTATLYATVANHGYSEVGEALTVTFYHQGTVMTPIGDAVIPAMECCGDQETVSVSWSDITDGVYRFCAIATTKYVETEPVCAHLWINAPFRVYLPIVAK